MRGAFGRGLAAAAALALLLGPGAATAAGPPGPRLAVIKQTWKPLRVKLITVNPSGGRPMRIAGGQEWDGPVEAVGQISWRPDGSEIAYPNLLSIFVARADGSGTRELNIAGAERPVYAPDGRTLAFTRYGDGGAAVWTIDMTTGVQRQLTPSRRGLVYVGSSFTADGKTLFATRIDRKRKGEPELMAIHLDTGRITRVLKRGSAPVLSPDGSKLVFLRETGKRRATDLFVLGVVGGSVKRLTRTPYKDEVFPSWDPSGERIAFARFRHRHFEWANSIVQINADGTCEEVILAQPRTVYYGTGWQPGPGREAGSIAC